jgi:hypothetical protein
MKKQRVERAFIYFLCGLKFLAIGEIILRQFEFFLKEKVSRTSKTKGK